MKPLDEKTVNVIMSTLARQREIAMNDLAFQAGEIAALKARVTELEAQLSGDGTKA